METKQTKSVLLAFFQGGTKVKIESTMEPTALKAEIDKAKKEVRDAEIDAANPDKDVLTDKFYLTRNALMFYSILTPKIESTIITSPSGIVAPSGTPIR